MFGLFGKEKKSPFTKRTRAVNFFNAFRRDRERAAVSGGFQGGKIDRITEEWRPGTIGPNRMFQQDGKLLRERAWDLYHNNPFAASAVNSYIANVIECGIMPERDGDWERAWNRWGGLTVHGTREADITRDQTIVGLQQLWLTEIIVGGGCLVHYVKMPRREQFIPLSLELIGEERFADHVQQFGRNPKTSNPVLNGVEIDPATGRTLAYHVRKHTPNDLGMDPLDTVRIPADECEYTYVKSKIGAKRGTTTLKPSIIWLWALGYYTDNELKNSDIKSTWAYMIKTSEQADIDWPDLIDSSPETGTADIYGNTIDKLEPQQIWRGFPGDEITPVGPNVPGGDSMPWITMIQRSIAVGMNLSYEETFRDYTKGSWSSVRSAMAADRKRFRSMQKFAICHFGNPTVRRFDEAAVANFTPGFPLPSAWELQRDEAWELQEWSVPGWESPNPKDDALADDVRLKNGTATYKSIMARGGQSWRKHFEQRLTEQSEPGYPQLAQDTVDSEPAETDDED